MTEDSRSRNDQTRFDALLEQSSLEAPGARRLREHIPNPEGEFLSDLSKLVADPAIRSLALRRAQSRELAEDAMQETFYAVAQMRDHGSIQNLRAFFAKSLIRTINRQLTLAAPILVGDIDVIADSGQDPLQSGTSSPDSVAGEAAMRLLAEAAFSRLKRDRDDLMAMIPARSADPRRYRSTILAAAGRILYQLLRGPVTMTDWNAALRSEYPQWCDEPELSSDTAYQRLSRARADVQLLLREILPRDMVS